MATRPWSRITRSSALLLNALVVVSPLFSPLGLATTVVSRDAARNPGGQPASMQQEATPTSTPLPPELTVTPTTTITLTVAMPTWTPTDPEDSHGQWLIRAHFYDSSDTYLGYEDAEGGQAGTLSTTWQQRGGTISTPSSAATMRIYLHNYMNSGWVAYDDLSLSWRRPTSYYYGQRARPEQGRRIAMRRDGVVYYLVGDHLGTTSLVLDGNGDLVAETRHYPYGEERWPNDGTVPTDYRFTGQRYDGYIKLTVMGARWYDDQLGRWISPDPMIPDPANPQSFNRLSYVYNNPVGFVDPSGHTPWWWRYAKWQAGMTWYSGFGKVRHPLVHGRNDVAANAEIIERHAPRSLELIVAASIAHQASDPRDRPYGTDAVEVMAGWVISDQSVGIAQLRPGEIERWVPSLAGESRYDPEVAIRVMTAKISYVEHVILAAEGEAGSMSKTDGYMLLALAQNRQTEAQIQATVDTFLSAGKDWDRAFATEFANRSDWKEQLRLMVLHIDWLLLNGWDLPDGVNLYYMRKKAFED